MCRSIQDKGFELLLVDTKLKSSYDAKKEELLKICTNLESYLLKNKETIIFFTGYDVGIFDIWILPMVRFVFELLRIFHDISLKDDGFEMLHKLIYEAATNESKSFRESLQNEDVIYCYANYFYNENTEEHPHLQIPEWAIKKEESLGQQVINKRNQNQQSNQKKIKKTVKIQKSIPKKSTSSNKPPTKKSTKSQAIVPISRQSESAKQQLQSLLQPIEDFLENKLEKTKFIQGDHFYGPLMYDLMLLPPIIQGFDLLEVYGAYQVNTEFPEFSKVLANFKALPSYKETEGDASLPLLAKDILKKAGGPVKNPHLALPRPLMDEEEKAQASLVISGAPKVKSDTIALCL